MHTLDEQMHGSIVHNINYHDHGRTISNSNHEKHLHDRAHNAFQTALTALRNGEIHRAKMFNRLGMGYKRLLNHHPETPHGRLNESTPPGMEDWVLKNKQRFIDEYGEKKGLAILYAKANILHKQKTKEE